MADYRVTAPFVNLRITGQSGKAQVNGLYAGAIVSGDTIDPAHLERHLDRGWLEKVDEPVPASTAEPAVAPATPTPEPPVRPEPASEKPSTADPKSTWVDYAVAQGNDREAAEAMTKADLVDLLK